LRCSLDGTRTRARRCGRRNELVSIEYSGS
jgi:hypothetical protein